MNVAKDKKGNPILTDAQYQEKLLEERAEVRAQMAACTVCLSMPRPSMAWHIAGHGGK